MTRRRRPRSSGDQALRTALWTVAVLGALLVGWGLWRTWADASAPTLRLRKDSWTCSEYRRDAIVTPSGRRGTRTDYRLTCVAYVRARG